MKVAAIICEFNPFHNGHKYLIEKVKYEHADCVVAIMSGNFVQRGDIAITDKYKRAEMALLGGCDLVVELPTIYALSSAENFAQGGVQIANALGADLLCFGAEDDNLELLTKIADISQSKEFSQYLKHYIADGQTYAKAYEIAVSALCGEEYAHIISKPNNTLAIEYIRALKNTNISPVAIKRKGTNHDSDIVTDNIASATHIRNLIKSNEQYTDFTENTIENPADTSKLETTILYKLRTMNKEEISNLPDVTEGLENRIFECARNSNSLEELYNNLKTKRYTLARLRRIIMCALLNITKDDVKSNAPYLRILAMNSKGTEIIRKSKLPIIGKVRKDYDKLSKKAKNIFDIDVRASEIYSLTLSKPEDFKNDFTKKIIIK